MESEGLFIICRDWNEDGDFVAELSSCNALGHPRPNGSPGGPLRAERERGCPKDSSGEAINKPRRSEMLVAKIYQNRR
jgi:hypothetical protein